MTIKQLQEKYKLDKNDFWEVRKGTWVITHNACEKIADIEGIIFNDPQVYVNQELTRIAMLGKGKLGEKMVWATGESNEDNTKGQGKYYWAMAEKRLKDRLTLKLINAYEYGIYSEIESDSFQKTTPYWKQKKEKETAKAKIQEVMDGLPPEPEITDGGYKINKKQAEEIFDNPPF